MASGFDTVSTFNPQQKSLFKQLMASLGGGQGLNLQQNPLFQSGQNYLQNILSGSPESSQAFEAPAMRQFQEQILPMIAERFSGLGAGAQGSSAFQKVLGQAGAGLSENLARLRGELQQGAVQPALQYAQQPYENASRLLGMNTQALIPKQQSWWQNALSGLSGGVGQGLGGFGINRLFGGR